MVCHEGPTLDQPEGFRQGVAWLLERVTVDGAFSGPVLYLGCTGHAGAVGAAVQGTVRLHTVADDPDAAVLAGRGECMDRTLEAVKRARLVSKYLYPERLAFGIPGTHILSGPTSASCGGPKR
jgi:hypothetical protein